MSQHPFAAQGRLPVHRGCYSDQDGGEPATGPRGQLAAGSPPSSTATGAQALVQVGARRRVLAVQLRQHPLVEATTRHRRHGRTLRPDSGRWARADAHATRQMRTFCCWLSDEGGSRQHERQSGPAQHPSTRTWRTATMELAPHTSAARLACRPPGSGIPEDGREWTRRRTDLPRRRRGRRLRVVTSRACQACAQTRTTGHRAAGGMSGRLVVRQEPGPGAT